MNTCDGPAHTRPSTQAKCDRAYAHHPIVAANVLLVETVSLFVRGVNRTSMLKRTLNRTLSSLVKVDIDAYKATLERWVNGRRGED